MKAAVWVELWVIREKHWLLTEKFCRENNGVFFQKTSAEKRRYLVLSNLREKPNLGVFAGFLLPYFSNYLLINTNSTK